MHKALSIADVVALEVICGVAQRTAKVARFDDSIQDVVFGTARSIGNQTFGFLKPGEDIRDAFLRVTTRGGFEVAWPVSALMAEVGEGQFAEYNWS